LAAAGVGISAFRGGLASFLLLALTASKHAAAHRP
jgi:hypothetical protein